MTPEQIAAVNQAQLVLEEHIKNNYESVPKELIDAEAALRHILTEDALDKKAENARELGLDYEPAGGTQISKVWWDGDKLMAKSIPLSEIYKEPEQQPAREDWGPGPHEVHSLEARGAE